MTKKRYWIGVACKDRLMIGVKGGFAQLQHGRTIPLQMVNESDWLIDNTALDGLPDDEPDSCFTALDKIASEDFDLLFDELEFDLGAIKH